MSDLRYQHQPWFVRRWRDRWLLTTPWVALGCWLSPTNDMRLSSCWGLARGLVDGKRGYWWTSEEVRERWGIE